MNDDATIERLTADNEKLRAELGRPYDKADRLFESNKVLIKERDELRARLEKAEADARRERYAQADHGVKLMEERDQALAQCAALAGALAKYETQSCSAQSLDMAARDALALYGAFRKERG